MPPLGAAPIAQAGMSTIGLMPIDLTRVRALLFDVDGTLADTDDQMISSLDARLGPLHGLFPRRDARPFLRWAVTTAIAPVNTMIGIPDLLHLDQPLIVTSNWVSDHIFRSGPGRFTLMSGVVALLSRLHAGFPLAIVSARSERATLNFLKQYQLDGFFSIIAHAQSARYTKPHPDPIYWCAERLGVAPDACVMIGDTSVDIRCAQRAGAQSIGVLCGFGSRNSLERAGADALLAHTTGLADLLSGQSVS